MFCPRCGSNENDSVKFCTNCGFVLSTENNAVNLDNQSQKFKKVKTSKIKDIANNEYTSSKFDAAQVKHANNINNNNQYYQQNQPKYPNNNYNPQTISNNNYGYNSYNTQNNNLGQQQNPVAEVEATSILDDLDTPIQQIQNNNNNILNQQQNSVAEVEATSILDDLDTIIDQQQNNAYINNLNQSQRDNFNKNNKYNYADLMNTRNNYTSSPMASSQENLVEVTEILDNLEEPLDENNTKSASQTPNSQYANPQMQNNFQYPPQNQNGFVNPQMQGNIPNQNNIGQQQMQQQYAPFPPNMPMQNAPYVQQDGNIPENSQQNSNSKKAKKQRSTGVKVICGILSAIVSIILALCVVWINASIILETSFRELSKGETIKSSGMLTAKLDKESLAEMFMKSANIKFNDNQLNEFVKKSTLSDFIANKISAYNKYINGEMSKAPKVSNIEIRSLMLANINVIEEISGETFTNEQIQTILNNIDNTMINKINEVIVEIPISQSVAKFANIFNKYFISVALFVVLFLLLVPLMNGVKKAGLCSGIILTIISLICLASVLILPVVLPSTELAGILVSQIFKSSNLFIPFVIEAIAGVLLVLVSVIAIKRPEKR